MTREPHFLLRKPPPPLNRFVDVFWTWEGLEQPHHKERLLPDGSMSLVINLRDDETRIYDREDHRRCLRLPGASVAGAQSQYFVIDTAEQLSVVGIHFKPGGGWAFFGMPADELRGQHVALDALWGNWAAELRERLLEAPSPQARLLILEQALLARAGRPLEQHPAVAFALAEFRHGPKIPSIAEVTRQIGLSPKRFIDVFRQQVGLTPKVFCRVRRFQNVLRQIRAGRELEWAGVALGCGYFDQAHFIHDFRAFSGLNPTAYTKLPLRNDLHVPILD